jgi:hypothetical protein
MIEHAQRAVTSVRLQQRDDLIDHTAARPQGRADGGAATVEDTGTCAREIAA